MGGLGAEVFEVKSSDVLHAIVVVIHKVNDIDESKGNPPINAAQISTCQIATEVDLLISFLDRIEPFILHDFILRGQQKFLLLVRFYHVHLFVFGVNPVEDLLVVVGQS